LLHEQGHRVPSRQILLYPVTHWDHDPATSPFDSVRRHGEDYRLTSTEMRDYFDLYVPDPQLRRSRLVSPLMAPDLTGQPETLMITAELDLLCDEGEAYAQALAGAGNRVRLHRVDSALHGFISLPRFGDGDLLALGGLVGVGGEFLAAEALPGGLVELEAAVVAVAG